MKTTTTKKNMKKMEEKENCLAVLSQSRKCMRLVWLSLSLSLIHSFILSLSFAIFALRTRPDECVSFEAVARIWFLKKSNKKCDAPNATKKPNLFCSFFRQRQQKKYGG